MNFAEASKEYTFSLVAPGEGGALGFDNFVEPKPAPWQHLSPS